MHRTSLTTLAVLAIGTSASAQHLASQALPVMNRKDAGTYHLASDTWNRAPSVRGCGPEVLFDNTCRVGFYVSVPSDRRFVDDGRVPSTTSPTNPGPPVSVISWTGTFDSYPVNQFEIGYCTFDPLPTIEVNFWDCFTGCADSTLVTPTATFTLANLPGAASAGACWTVTVDLQNAGMSFVLQADCDGRWYGGGTDETFGWSWQQTTPSTGGTPGPILAGDPKGYLNGGPGSSGCDVGANTVFYAGSDINNTEGTGLDGLDQYEEDTVSPTPAYFGCWWLGGYDNGNLYASFHLQLAGSAGGVCVFGQPYCLGDGIAPHTPCPFQNNNDGSIGGCDWGNPAFPSGGVLDAIGDNDWASNNMYLVAMAVENDFGIFFGASNATNGGNGSQLNDGLRCAGGGLIRLTPPTMATGHTATLPSPLETLDAGGGPGITRRYQYWFRTPNGPGGTMANLTNGYEIPWL